MIPGLAPFRMPWITPGLQASGRQPAIQETSSSSCSIGGVPAGLSAHPCAVTHDQPYREGRGAACGMHDGRDISATAIQEDPVGGRSGHSPQAQRCINIPTG